MKNNPAGMSLIVKTITRLTVGLIFIYGIYIVLEGDRGPGGGFAGGIILALSFIQLMLAFGKDAVLSKVNQAKSLVLMAAGVVVFLLLISLGLFGCRFSDNFSLGEIAVALMVGAGLFLVFLTLVSLNGERLRE
jgi:multicomponent Na+:H+ antiporter subunit B